MRFLLIILLVGLICAGACSRKGDPSDETSARTPSQLRWHTKFEDAVAEAQETGKTVLAAFYAYDCPLCKAMDDSTYADDRVISTLRNLVAVRLEIETDSLLSRALHVREQPTALFLRSDGTEIDRIVGFVGPGIFTTRAQNILAGRRTLEDLLTHEEDHLNDTPYLIELAQKLYHTGEQNEALTRLARVWEVDPQNRLGVTDRALFMWGRILNEQDHHSQSIDQFDRLIDSFPQSSLVPEARLYRAVSMLGVQGRGQEGINELAALAQEYPDSRIGRWAREQLEILGMF